MFFLELLLYLLIYFLLAIAAAALVLLPAVREQAFARGRSFFITSAKHINTFRGQSAQVSQNAGGAVTTRAKDIADFIKRRRYLVLGVASIVTIPPMIAFTLRRHSGSGFEFSDTFRGPDEKVFALLAGEQLVPPPELPPEAFLTKEVELIRPALVTANRKWDALDADFSQRLLTVYKIMREKYGYEMAILEGYRSPERQEKLAAMGTSVTNAGAFQSYHQFGLAADNGFYRDGKIVISEKDPWAARGYTLYGEVAESLGLTWGGRWKMMDLGHVELRRRGVLGQKS